MPRHITKDDLSTLVVTEFGVKGDGTTDDTVAIQAAIDAAIAQNKSLLFPNGQYLISDADGDHTALKIVNASNFRMYGALGATIKTTSGFWGGMITFENCYNVEVTGLTIQCDGDGAVNSAPGISGIRFIKDSKYIRIHGNFFKGLTDSAITILSTSPDPDTSGLNIADTTRANTIITNNHFTACEHCLITKYGGTRNTVIANNIVYQCCFGFKIDGEVMTSYSPLVWKDPATLSGNTTVVGNVFSEMDTKVYDQSYGLGAVMFEENVENVLVANNIMSDFRNVCGVTMTGGQGNRPAKNITICNNKMTNFNTGYGISLTSGTGRDLEDVSIEGNTFKNFNAAAMRIETKQAIKGLSIRMNKFRDICQNTAMLGTGFFYPTDIGIYITNKTPSTYYAQDVVLASNDFMTTSASTFDENKPTITIEGLKTYKHEDIRIENNYIVRGFTTNYTTNGVNITNIDKLIVRDNYFENGRMFVKNADIIYRRNKFKGHRLALGANGSTFCTATIEDADFSTNGSGQNEYFKAENNTAVAVKNITIESGMYLVTTTGATYIDRSQVISKTAAPTLNAAFIGQQCVDTTNKKVYVATATGTGASDWSILN